MYLLNSPYHRNSKYKSIYYIFSLFCESSIYGQLFIIHSKSEILTVRVTFPAFGSTSVLPLPMLSKTMNFSWTSISPWGKIVSAITLIPPSPSP